VELQPQKAGNMIEALSKRDTNARVKNFLLLFVATLVTACGSNGTTPVGNTGAWPTRADVAVAKTGFSADGLAKLNARMKEAVDQGQVSGIVTLLARHGHIAQFTSHGVQAYETGVPMTDKTLFRIYSMTKPVTGVAMMQLYEKGLWKLDDPITRYLPEFAALKVMKSKDAPLVDAKRPATMRELMTHTAGFGYGLSLVHPVDQMFSKENPLGKPDMKSMVATVAQIPLLAQPGERWSYSIAVDLQGAVVERLSGKKFGEYLQENIFGPLHMTDTQFFVPEAEQARVATVYQWDRAAAKLTPMSDPPGRDFFAADHVESGGGGLVSSIHDYARFAQMLLNKGTLDRAKILKSETVELMTQNHIGDLRVGFDGNAATTGNSGSGFGLDFAVVYNPELAKTQQGTGTYSWFGIAGTWFWVDPTNDLFYIGMIQRRGGAGQGAVNFRTESVKLVYEALADR
jgi:CubicO group peptidase (beta-lactamase class C family)